MGTLLLRGQGPLLFPHGGTEAAGGSEENDTQCSVFTSLRYDAAEFPDAPIFLRFAAVFTLAGGHLARDDGREKCRVNDADGTVLQGGEFQRGANANGDDIHGSNDARAHDEGGPL